MEQFRVELEIDPKSRHEMTKSKTRLAQDPPPNYGKRSKIEARKSTITAKKKNNPTHPLYATSDEEREESPEPVVRLTAERRAAAEIRIAQQKAEIEEQKRNGTYVDPMEVYEAELKRANWLKSTGRGGTPPVNPFRDIVLARIEKERQERERQAAAEVGDPEAQAATYAENRRKLGEARLYMRRFAIEEAAKKGLPPPPEEPLELFDMMEHYNPERADAPPGPSYEEIMARVKRPQVIAKMLEEEAAKKEEAAKESTSNSQVKSCTKRKRAHREAEEQELNGSY
ncbi:hypothetical protein GCK72_021348 [Caenorhabditis remanei]|uniref:Uncharacterized protein n=1 Tax=Caenorhabditis remanei TaxID=31234 RepID=A0A6A5GJ60_CAERE|nr:hypothetical protein GCK72_021348 [Caenorhabditis remanei]KAF1754784.1 hypothetical protein GCK72_021348 [Caenorhabditis remanei]